MSCSTPQAKTAVESFLAALPELNRLKSVDIKRDASRGYFVGLDGRKVKCNSEHLMLAGYLQNAEAVITKSWIREWHKQATKEDINFKLVDFVHDETQTEVKTEEEAKQLIIIQKKAMETVSKDLNLFCPMDTESSIGFNWSETH